MAGILHISYDLRNSSGMETTAAVKNLIKLSNELDSNQIIDLVRITNFKQEKISLLSKEHITIDSFGLPWGIFLLTNLKKVAKKIFELIKEEIVDISKINIIHCHKLTFEGYIGYILAKRFNKDLVITIRQTDTWVLFYKPFSKFIFKKILRYAKVVFYVNPYSKVLLEKRLGGHFFNIFLKSKLVLLPNIVERETQAGKNPGSGGRNFLTILRMDRKSVKRKNLKNLLKAFALVPNYNLDIIGSGDYEDVVKSWVKNLGIQNRINFLGKIPNAEIDRYLQSSIAFLLPSHSETFGLVYAEALLNGTPILYSKNRLGFDGFFENVGPKVEPNSVESIKAGILECVEKELFFKKHIKTMISSGKLNIFSRENIHAIYFDSLKL